MSFIELANRRYSCRSYIDTPVERDKLVACVEAGILAPSACNSQPWSFVIIDNPEIAKKFAECLRDPVLPINGFTRNVNAYIVVIEENANMKASLGGKIKDQEYAQIDIGLAASNICMNATDLNLGTCIIGWFNEKKIKSLLGISGSRKVRLAIAVGYPTENAQRQKVRKPLSEKVRFNGWTGSGEE